MMFGEVLYLCYDSISHLDKFDDFFLVCRLQVIQIPVMHVLPLLESLTNYGWNMRVEQMI